MATLLVSMGLAEIKHEITRLSRAESDELALQLAVLRDLEDPAFVSELTQAHADAERGTGPLTREELVVRLRSAGRTVSG